MPSVTLRPIATHNWRECIRLNAGDDGRFVAPNVVSLAQAWSEPGHVPRAIYSDEIMVGFVMWQHDVPEDAWVIVRLMTDLSKRRMGYARAATRIAIAEMKASAPDRRILLSLVPGNDDAARLYESIGFRPTGEVIDGEAVYMLDRSRSADDR
ncbi:MAG: GNAT family N-acetyltransferase [Planctomycetes bacterium]|nr:GNAT family N-acetyltransferase [Planctomycetota bacterium]